MANGFYDYSINNLLKSTTTVIDFDSATLKMVLTDHGTDTPNLTSDDFLNDISTGTVGTSSSLSSVTVRVVAVGVIDAADMSPAFSAVSGSSVESMSLIEDSGSAATSTTRSVGYFAPYGSPIGGSPAAVSAMSGSRVPVTSPVRVTATPLVVLLTRRGNWLGSSTHWNVNAMSSSRGAGGVW